MRYHIKLTMNKYAPPNCRFLEGDYDSMYINDNSDILFLYEGFIDENGVRAVERTSIPLHAVDTLEVKMIHESMDLMNPVDYEDNR